MKTNPTLRSARLLLALAVGVAACAGSQLGPPRSPPIDWRAFEVRPKGDAGAPGPTANERAAAASYVGALTSGDFTQLATVLAADAHFLCPGVTEARGIAAVLAAHVTLFGAFGPRSISVTRMWRAAGVHVIEWTMSGMQTREWMGVKPAGRRCRQRPASHLDAG